MPSASTGLIRLRIPIIAYDDNSAGRLAIRLADDYIPCGLRNIPVELTTAPTVEGAGVLRRFFSITLPLLTPIIFFNLVMQAIVAFQAFTPSFIISNGTGGPVGSTLFYTLYLYQKAFTEFQMGYASALAWILVAIVAAFTATAFLSSKQ